jgi:alpha-beta hydrolase superfamily lysophospholipase
MMKLEFPIGYYRFHSKQLFNFQLNRWHSLGYMRRRDMEEAGRNVRSFADWKRIMIGLSESALAEGRLVNAAFCCRAAEFYTRSKDPEKDRLYNRFVELFGAAFAGEGIERHEIPYAGAILPAMRVSAAAERKGVIILHGGFDSFIEEWYSMMRYFSDRGYEVVGFEGPGQGAALRKHGLPLTYEWEKPLAAVLNYFRPVSPALIGMSMGGWFALRAAAFEPRVARVIASGHAIDYMKCMPPGMRRLHLWCMEHCRAFMDRMAELKFERRENMASWVVDHMKYITRRERPLDALEIYLQMNEENMHSELVTQDALVLAGEKDHFIPRKMHNMQIRALTGARSVTGRVFTAKEHAQNHCQIGNVGLALGVMAGWLDGSSAK